MVGLLLAGGAAWLLAGGRGAAPPAPPPAAPSTARPVAAGAGDAPIPAALAPAAGTFVLRGKVLRDGAPSPARVTAWIARASLLPEGAGDPRLHPGCDPEPRARAEAGPDGLFVLAGLAPGAYRLEAVAPDRARGSGTAWTPEPGEEEEPEEIELRPGAFTLRGRALLSDGSPWTGMLALRDSTWPQDLPAPLPADAEGRFRAEGLAAAEVRLLAAVPGERVIEGPVVLLPCEEEVLFVVGAGWRDHPGTVAAAADGAPVPGAVVTAGDGRDEERVIARAVADAGGAFLIALPPDEGLELVVRAPGYPAMSRTLDPIPPGGTPDLAFLLPRPAAFTGRVLDGEGGTPLPGVTVALFPESEGPDPAPEGGHQAVTGSDGRFHLPSLPPGRARFLAFGAGRVSREAASPAGWNRDDSLLALAPGRTTERDLVVVPAPRARGRVVDGAGAPVAGAAVAAEKQGVYDGDAEWLLWRADPSGAGATSGTDGSFAFPLLMPGLDYGFIASAEGRAPAAFGPLRAVAGEEMEVLLALPADRRVVVRVVESEGGAPVPGAVVEATATLLPREGRPLEGEWIAGPDGTVSVGPLPAAPVHLTARRAEEWHSSDPVAVEDVAGTLEIPLPPVDAKEDVVVEGIVLLPDGSPAAGARLTAWSSGWGCLSLEFGTPPRADFRGRFRIEVPSWSINLSASLVKDGRSYEAFVSAEVEEGVRSLAGLEVRLRDEALEAAGLAEDGEGDRAFVRVAGPDGAPVPQGRVHFHFLDYEDGRTSEGRTLLDGRAAALAPTDEPVESLWIEVVEPADAEGRPLPLAHGTFGPFALSPGRTEIEVRLSPARTLAGLVLDPDGRGIPGLGVAAAPWLEEFVEGRSWSAGTVSLATTDAEGRFLLDRLGDRDYEVTVGLGRDRAPAEPVRARPGGEDLRFVLGPAVAAVVRVLDAGGRPVKEARVEARSPLHDISALTDAEGKVRLAGLDPTRPYRLSVDPPRKRDDLREAVIPDWRPADVVVALPASVVLVVTVRDPRGAPLEGIFVGWESAEEPGSVRGGTTDGDGTVRLRDLPAGALRIEAGLPGAGGSPARVAAATVDSGAGKVDLVLDPGPGTVLRLAAGIDPRLVLVSFARGGDLEPVQAETGKDGRIHLRGLAPGEDYNVFLRDLDTGRCALLRGVRAGDAEREVALAEGKEISGKVHLPPGADSFNVAVLVGKTILIDGEPGEGGAFRFPSVPPGTWTLVAYLTTEDGAYHAATAEVAAGGTVEIRVP
ncbi:MAG: carboxypeptidase regulatory-like domain-containing protein [Planctomycetes bacterium]|nr:carboxypeptidase regulatory-like domain-containing protein [Planctomycetota bacterium]